MPEGHGFTPRKSYPYGVWSNTSRIDLINQLNDEDKWKGLLTDSKVASKNVKITGAVDLETWIKSWNTNTNNTHLATSLKIGMNDGLDGYYVVAGEGEDVETRYNCFVYSDVGYNNTLYFPYQYDVSNCYGYRLASPSAYDTDSVVEIGYGGTVSYTNYSKFLYGLRPVIRLGFDVLVEQDRDGVWQVK